MKLPISAALLFFLPFASLVPLCAATAAPQDATQEARRELRRELAQVGKRMLEAERDRDKEAFDRFEARLNELMQALGGIESHEDAVERLRSVFAEFEPEALDLLRLELEPNPNEATQAKLRNLESGLEMFHIVLERYPSTEEGLQILLTGGELGAPIVEEHAVIDGWGQVFTYKTTGERSYELRSAGPDSTLGTADDVVFQSGSELEAEPAGSLFAFGTLNAGDKLDCIHLAERGPLAAYRVKRADQTLVVVNGFEHPVFDHVDYPLISPAGNVVVYTAQLGSQHFLVVDGTPHKIAERPIGGIRFVENTDIFAAPFYTSSSGIEWTMGDGEWLLSYSENKFRPSIYPPVTSDDHHTLAIRVKQDDQWVVHDRGRTSDPSPWVSQPAAIPGKRAVTYRFGDDHSTTMVVGGQVVGLHNWARNPVFNAAGDNYAYAVSIGGQPTKHFDAVANLDPKEKHIQGILHGPAYSGGTYNMIFNGKVGPPFAFVQDPVFDPTGTRIAYIVQLEEEVSAVHHNENTSAGYRYVDSLTFDSDGTSLAFVGTRDEKQYLVIDGNESTAHADIQSVVGGAEGTFAYVSVRADGNQFLNVGWSSMGPFDRIDQIGFMADGKTPFARVKKGEKHGVLIGNGMTRWFDQIGSLITSTDHPTPTYVAHDGENVHVVTGNNVSRAFVEVQKPALLGDGRVVYLALEAIDAEGGTEESAEQPKRVHRVMVNGVPEPNCRVLEEIQVSPDGFRAFYIGEFEDGSRRVVEVGGPSYTPKDALLDFVMFDQDSRLVIQEAGDVYERLVIDNITQPAYDRLSLMSVRTTPSPLTAQVTVGGKQAYVSGSLTSPYFEFISDPIFSPDGETLACRAKNGESWHLTIGRWSSESYDEVFAPQFTEDGLAVTCAVRIGLDLFRLTVPIDSIER